MAHAWGALIFLRFHWLPYCGSFGVSVGAESAPPVRIGSASIATQNINSGIFTISAGCFDSMRLEAELNFYSCFYLATISSARINMVSLAAYRKPFPSLKPTARALNPSRLGRNPPIRNLPEGQQIVRFGVQCFGQA